MGSRHIKFYHLAQAFPTESGWWPSPPSDPIYSDSAYISSNTHTIDPAFARALDPKSSEQVEWTALAETLKSLLDRFKFAYINQEDFTDSLIHKKYASLKDRTHISLEGAAVRTECPPNLKYKGQSVYFNYTVSKLKAQEQLKALVSK